MGLRNPAPQSLSSSLPTIHRTLSTQNSTPPGPSCLFYCSECYFITSLLQHPRKHPNLLGTDSHSVLLPQSVLSGPFSDVVSSSAQPIGSVRFQRASLWGGFRAMGAKGIYRVLSFFFFPVTFETSFCCASTHNNLSIPPFKPKFKWKK